MSFFSLGGEKVIEFKGVSKSYLHESQAIQALKNITVTVGNQEILGIVGQSGSGKSTILKLLNQMEALSAGELLFDGVDVSRLPSKEQRLFRKKIGIVFQQFNLLNNLTVFDNVALPLKLAGQQDAEKVQRLLSFVGMSAKEKVYPSQLSGGESQRVAIARALISDPDLLLCDEPTSALEPQNAAEIVALLKQVNTKFKTTIIVVSHDFEIIKSLCQRAILLEKGELVKEIPIVSVNEDTVFTSYLERAVVALS